MSGRIFQNVVLQLKENTDRTVGVIDGEGIVIACSELSMIGQRWAEHVPVINGASGSMVSSEGKTFKALNGWNTQFDYAAFAFGDNEVSKTVCAMATVALNAAKSAYEEEPAGGSSSKTSFPIPLCWAISICGPRSCASWRMCPGACLLSAP